METANSLHQSGCVSSVLRTYCRNEFRTCPLGSGLKVLRRPSSRPLPTSSGGIGLERVDLRTGRRLVSQRNETRDQLAPRAWTLLETFSPSHPYPGSLGGEGRSGELRDRAPSPSAHAQRRRRRAEPPLCGKVLTSRWQHEAASVEVAHKLAASLLELGLAPD